jgi:hypothetical protein
MTVRLRLTPSTTIRLICALALGRERLSPAPYPRDDPKDPKDHCLLETLIRFDVF